MGTIYKCCCSACSHDFTIYDGDGMHSIGLICNGCGKRSSIPRQAPRPPREGRDVPSFLQTSRYFSLPPIPDADIRRFTAKELLNIEALCKTSGSEDTDQWDEFETAALIAQKNPCQCGGRVDLAAKTARTGTPNGKTRCPACRSHQITATNTGAWD
jgi:hypothetical protein